MPTDECVVQLHFLLVSNESTTRDLAQSALKKIGGKLECAASTDAACDLIKSRKVDAVILDVDISSALHLVGQMRRSKNARAFAFVCVNNDAEEAVALKGGANALLKKPLTADGICSSVSSFRPIIASERRRGQRHSVTLPVVITFNQGTYPGIVENISQGGMAVRLPCLLPESSIVKFSFNLESGIEIEGSAQLRWSNKFGVTGMEFRTLAPANKDGLLTWLSSQSARAG
jgi:CheY-like chemotaxis protein